MGAALPFEPLPPLPAAAVRAIEAAALRANDRYLHELIEQYSFCPFAKGGRKAGQTSRYVYYADSTSVEPLLELMARIARNPQEVVAQVILPLVQVEPEAWIELCHELTALGHARMGGPPVLACAALHPELPYNARNPLALVPLFRRAPDPTIQWVRLDGLDAIYEGRDTSERYLDPRDIESFVNDAPPARPPLYNRVAETNMKMAESLGLARVEAMLADYAKEAQARYRGIVLEHTARAPEVEVASESDRVRRASHEPEPNARRVLFAGRSPGVRTLRNK